MATPEAEGDEPVPIPDLSVLGKTVISGQVLSLQDFHKVAEDKALGNQIIQALEKTGLLKLCTYSFTGYIWKKLSKFCTKALPLTKNNKFKQKIGYGFVISEILITNGVNMRKGKKVACYKYLFRNHKTLRKKQIDSTSRATQSSDAPTAKAGQRRKRTSKVPEGGDSNEASYVVRSNANEEVVTSAMQITTTMSDVPNDEAAQMNSLPIQEELLEVMWKLLLILFKLK
nr:uncharacterized protein LOC109192376 [Ipomoea trifida]